jgi:protein-S-isoprenylcysteine O-methyltransferase Ste14
MYLFLAPLLAGFAANLASAFTAVYSHWWGERRGTLVTFTLRLVLGLPVWVTGFALAAVAPSPLLFRPSIAAALMGALATLAGLAVLGLGFATLQVKSVLPSTRDRLIDTGIYGLIRHPIHTGTLLQFLGLLASVPKISVALACLLGLVWVGLQTRFEEIDLLQRLPGYGDYMRAVPAYLPRLRR